METFNQYQICTFPSDLQNQGQSCLSREMGYHWRCSSEENQEEFIRNTQPKCSCLLTVINAASSLPAFFVVQPNSCD